jgi:YD repeat-containing protein
MPDGGRAHYRRIAGRTGHVGAVFEHTTSPSEYRGSRLFWDGDGWTIQLRDGSVYTYPDCPPWLNKPCTVSSYRDPEGHTIRIQHDRRVNAVRIQSDQSTIALTYDALDRIVLARSSTGLEVRYRYDALGRLAQVSNSDGSTSRYEYDDAHQMVRIREPGVSIRNAFDSAGRCIVNDASVEVDGPQGGVTVNRFLYKFAYTVNAAGKITATEVQRPSSLRKVTFNEQGYVLSDTVEGGNAREFGSAFEREVGSNVGQRLTVWCGTRKKTISVDPESSTKTMRRVVELACRGLDKD